MSVLFQVREEIPAVLRPRGDSQKYPAALSTGQKFVAELVGQNR